MEYEGRAERALARLGRALDRRGARDGRSEPRTPEQRRFTKRVALWALGVAVALGLVVPVLAALPPNVLDALSLTGAFALLGATVVAVDHARRSADSAALQVHEQARREERQAARDAAEALDAMDEILKHSEARVAMLVGGPLDAEPADVSVQLVTRLIKRLGPRMRTVGRASAALPPDFAARLNKLVELGEEISTPMSITIAATRFVLARPDAHEGTTPDLIRQQVDSFPRTEAEGAVDFERILARPWAAVGADAARLVIELRALAARP